MYNYVHPTLHPCGHRVCVSGVLLHIPPLGPRFESHRGHCVDWVLSPYLTAWVFPGKILMGFPPTSPQKLKGSGHCW